MNITKLKEEAWKLYREYLEAKEPTEEQTFLAQEALDVLIQYGFDDFDKNVARYNLACIYIDIRRYDLAEKLLLEIQEHGGLSGSEELLADIYQFGDAQVRDPQKAEAILQKLDDELYMDEE